MEQMQIQHIIDSLLMKSGSTAGVKLETMFPGSKIAGGKYSMGSHTITLYIEEIKSQCLHMFSSLDRFFEYVAIVFAHEIGHAEDKELEYLADQLDVVPEMERRQIALQIEENAWRYAETLLPEMDQSFMQTIIFHSLKSYREHLQPVGA